MIDMKKKLNKTVRTPPPVYVKGSKPKKTKSRRKTALLIVFILFVIMQLISVVFIGRIIYGGKYNKETRAFEVAIGNTARRFVSFTSIFLIASSIGSMVMYMIRAEEKYKANNRTFSFLTSHITTIILTVQVIGSILLYSMLSSGENVPGSDVTRFAISELDEAILRVSFPLIVIAFFGGAFIVGQKMI